MIKTWWINNSWRFWAVRWVLASDPYQAVEAWQEYRHMLNPSDERSLVDQIIEDYDKDIDAALQNPIVAVAWWLRGLVREVWQ